MAIHARGHSEDESPEPSCKSFVRSFSSSYSNFLFLDFYNYFQHGIDFLISDHTHVVKKIILHSNVVGVFPLRFSQFLTFNKVGDTPLSTIQALSLADRR